MVLQNHTECLQFFGAPLCVPCYKKKAVKGLIPQFWFGWHPSQLPVVQKGLRETERSCFFCRLTRQYAQLKPIFFWRRANQYAPENRRDARKIFVRPIKQNRTPVFFRGDFSNFPKSREAAKKRFRRTSSIWKWRRRSKIR
jgi:hypothetical protein